jgi:hypothetical protein
MTLQASAFLMLAIVTGILWNRWMEPPVAPGNAVVESFLRATCQATGVHCLEGLVPDQRTQKAVALVHDSVTVLRMPRRLLILDVDALRDSFVRECLFPASTAAAAANSSSANDNKSHASRTVAADAFLAAHLARLQTNTTAAAAVDPILQQYVQHVLPRYSDFQFHPVVWFADSDPQQQQQLLQLLPPHSSAAATVRALAHNIGREYRQFTAACPEFSRQVSQQDYTAARLSVMTRSFGTGPLPTSELASAELEYYQTTVGLNLSVGSHAMVPILDLYNHHAVPNVAFKYDGQAFLITAVNGGIVAGSQIMDSYGKHTDTHLFAKYGFVNGDGSDHTQASLALYHQPELVDESDNSSSVLHKQLLRYIQYDNGYEQCVAPTDKAAWAFKILKYQYLVRQVSNQPTSWTVMLAPRDPESRPAAFSNIPITDQVPRFDKKRIQLVGQSNAVFSTCRLLSLTHHDYNGTAVSILTEHLGSNATTPPLLPAAEDALEFRTLMCMARMSQIALTRMGVSTTDQEATVARLNSDRSAFQSRNWTVAHVLLGELQTLEAVKGVAYSSLRAFSKEIQSGDAAYTLRDKPCPVASLQPLLQHV